MFSECQAWHVSRNRHDFRLPVIHFLDHKLIQSFYEVNLTAHGEGKHGHLDLFNKGVTDSFELISGIPCSADKKDFYLRMLQMLLEMYRLRQNKLDRLRRSLSRLNEDDWNKLKQESDQHKTQANLDVSVVLKIEFKIKFTFTKKRNETFSISKKKRKKRRRG